MIRSTLFAFALFASTSAVAQTKAQAPAPAPTAGEADKKIPKADVVANADKEFAEVDTNKDGKMSRTEIETFQRGIAVEMATARNKAVFAALDADNNGQLSAAEFAKLNSGTPKVDPSNVLRIDTNKDGQVSLAEHRSATLATFTQFDTNKDGALTAAEVKAARDK